MAKSIHTGMTLRQVLALNREWDTFNASPTEGSVGNGWAQLYYRHLLCPPKREYEHFDTEEEFLSAFEKCTQESGLDWGVYFDFRPAANPWWVAVFGRWNIGLLVTIGPDGKVKDVPKVHASGP
jgi:hypothetical protein